MKRYFAVLTMIVLGFVPAGAWFSQGTSGQAGEYLLSLSGGARGMSLGLAQTALNGQANLMYSNPASLSGLWWKEGSFTYIPLFFQAQFAGMFYGHVVDERRALGIGLLRLTSGDAEKTNAFGETIGTFSSQDTAFMFGYSQSVFESLSCGMNLKMVSQEIDTYSQKGYGADVGLIYCHRQRHVWALNIVNAVSPVVGPDRFPLTPKFGTRQPLFVKDLHLNADIEVVNAFENEIVYKWFAGIEYNRPSWFWWRAGANEKQVALGFGASAKQVDIDYAFVHHPLDYVHSLTMSFRYGFAPTEAEKRIRQEWKELEEEKEDAKRQVEKEKEKIAFEKKRLKQQKEHTLMFMEAKRHYDNKKYGESRSVLEKILESDPSYEEARKLLSEIDAREDSGTVVRRIREAKNSYSAANYGSALNNANFVLGLQPENIEARIIVYLSTAQLFLKEKRYGEAKSELIEVLKINPDNKEATQLLKRIQTIIEIYDKE
ncbi:MAG: PorV/PorQ family protein [Endomicrobiales bacterium]|nr:PorV/PorQ family protein [Endomicrobiales bacterium]